MRPRRWSARSMQMFPRPGTAGGTGSSGHALGVRARACGGGGSGPVLVHAGPGSRHLLGASVPYRQAGQHLGSLHARVTSSSRALAGRGGWDRAPGAEILGHCVPAPVGGGGWNWSQLREQPGLVRAHPGFPAGVEGDGLQLSPPGLQMWEKRGLEKGGFAVLQPFSPCRAPGIARWQSKGFSCRAVPSCSTQSTAPGCRGAVWSLIAAGAT